MDDAPGRIRTPVEAAIAADLIETTLAGLDESYVAVFNLRLRGHTEEEIAAKQNCTRAFVRTKLSRIRDRLERLRAGGTPAGNRQPAESADLLRDCLQTPASEYLGIATQPGQRKKSGGRTSLEQEMLFDALRRTVPRCVPSARSARCAETARPATDEDRCQQHTGKGPPGHLLQQHCGGPSSPRRAHQQVQPRCVEGRL